ncbi:MAG: RloB family protein [Catenulispora sp.]
MGKKGNLRPYRPITVGQGRQTDLRRKVEIRESSYSILITTNGKSTEVAYLEELRKVSLVSQRIARYKVKFFGKAPGDLLRVSLAELHRLGYDHLYAVTDLDEFGDAVVAAAVSDFAARRARLVVCNPCFEAWLVLHFEDCRAHLHSAAEAKERLRRHVADYDKARLDFSKFADRVEVAAQYARRVENAVGTNPSSTMWMIIDGLSNPDFHDERLNRDEGQRG